jgi:hypothetical protein
MTAVLFSDVDKENEDCRMDANKEQNRGSNNADFLDY